MNGFKRTIGVGATMALAALGIAVAGPAQADALPCGTEITSNTTLTADIGPCFDVGIEVGADNITLDLNGHTIFGPPTSGTDVRPQLGVELFQRSGVTVRNGTITGFDTGVYLESSTHNTITGLNVTNNISNGGNFNEGIQTYLSDNNVISMNRVTGNGPGGGIIVYDGTRNIVDRNVVQGNNIRPGPTHTGAPASFGIWIIYLGDRDAPATGNIVTNNTVDTTGLDGIQISRHTDGNTVKGNTVTNNGLLGGSRRDGDGIAIFGSRNVVQDNVVRGNGESGIHDYAGATGNIYQRNIASGNNVGPNPDVQYDLRDDNANCDANRWMGNTGTRNQACIH